MFLCLAISVLAGAAILPAILQRFSRFLPDNYEFIAADALRKHELHQAEAILERRISQFTYDFDAHFQLANVLSSQGQYTRAADVLKQILQKLPAAYNRSVHAQGFDEPRVFKMISINLWKGGKYREAGEMARVASDLGDTEPAQTMYRELGKHGDAEAAAAVARVALKDRHREKFSEALRALDNAHKTHRTLLQAQWLAEVEKNTTAAIELVVQAQAAAPEDVETKLHLAWLYAVAGAETSASEAIASVHTLRGIRPLPPGTLALPQGALVTSASVEMPRRGVARADINTGVYRVTTMAFESRGSSALGLFPIVIVSIGSQEVTREYLDDPRGRVREIVLWPEGAPTETSIAFDFSNDMFDPLSKADRNVSLRNIFLY